MDWMTVVLILGILAIVGVLVIGGKAKVSKDSIAVDTPGFLHWLRKAREERGTSGSTPAQPVDPKPKQRLLKLPRATIVWADDKPLNNQFERLAFASAGIFCDSYTTNDDTKKALDRAKYDLVISDIGRDGRAETGWDLLPDVKRRNIPFVFYTMGITDELQSEAKAEGAAGITENPDELTQLVFDLIARRA